MAGGQFAGQDETEPGFAPTTVSPADAGAVRVLYTIAEVEQLIDDYGNCIMANRDSGAFAIQLDRVKGTIGQAQTSHKDPAALDAIDAAESLCDSKLAFSSSISLADRYDEPTPDSEWIVFGKNPTGWEDADWIIEIHLDTDRPLNRLDPIGQLLADHPDIASGTFQAPSTYRVVPRQSPIPEDLITAITDLDEVVAVWRIAKRT
ncbi:MAG: hypothetical protein KDB16_01075 [Acidimicrobiales bacterium]|nr:hypothetical protein [Acidimicrobiales bacterium]